MSNVKVWQITCPNGQRVIGSPFYGDEAQAKAFHQLMYNTEETVLSEYNGIKLSEVLVKTVTILGHRSDIKAMMSGDVALFYYVEQDGKYFRYDEEVKSVEEEIKPEYLEVLGVKV